MIAIYIILALVGGFAAGFLFQKSQSHKYIIENELLKQQAESIKNIRDESLQATKAAALEVSQSLTTQLLETHKRENAEAKKQAEEMTKRETEKLQAEFKNVVEKLAAIDGQNKNQEQKISAIWQGLISPVKATNFAEIGLENTLKVFGLTPGIDFTMQMAIEGSRLKPDAIINLPGGNVMLIDAKTSRFFMEETEKLKTTMHKHLQDLAQRDYAGAVKQKENIFVVNVMYLPTETALAKVLDADRDFTQKCIDNGIILATPSSLQLLLHIATHHIATSKQEQNYRVILAEMGKVISSLDVLFRGMAEVGSAIKNVAEKFSKLGSSVNTRLLPRVKRIIDLGVEPENNAKLPAQVQTITVTENVNFIELEEERPLLRKVENQ